MANIIALFTILVSLKVISSLKIQQSPQHLLIKPEQSEVKLSCQHGDSSHQYMYWYQQKAVSDSIELIGMLVYENPTPEEKFKTRFNISGHSTGDAFLLISSLTPEFSAVYFCAATSVLSKAVFQTPQDLLKNVEDTAVLYCSHNVTDYNRILWYKMSSSGSEMKYLGNLFVETPNPEESRINLSGDGR
ncbi:hypothetical protein KOW79_008480 [Hemibagrus wyckioides]|uniref:Ig-like domain-containing protein n=1 Tax=Hemibagrus wyckioides TaxID=337641 RepID=A0A9D3SL03_9TELE|nr:hypothetical protein KOW79_008480 [Hemibagrus wyckioides]